MNIEKYGQCGGAAEMRSNPKRCSIIIGAITAIFVLSGSPVMGQQSTSGQKALEEIVVTGSRIGRQDGFEAQTPVTVRDAEVLQRGAPTNLADALNQLPQFQNSVNEGSNDLVSFDLPQAGNNLNLRGVGPVRGLILLDGRRVPPTSFVGPVDVNLLPQLLVERVDVVTAGASAVYGADAVSGAVNYVLDEDFEGVKVIGQLGQSGESDNDTHKIGVAGGTSLQDDRMHVLFSVEQYDSDGIPDINSRSEWRQSYLVTGAGTQASPYRVEDGVRFNSINRGGLILTGPLAGQQFTPAGELAPFDPGTPAASPGFSVDFTGDGTRWPNKSLRGSLRSDAAFGRLSYEFTPEMAGFVEVSWAESENTYTAHPPFTFGPDITIFSGNPFLPDDAQAVLDATGTDAFGMTKLHVDMGMIDNIVENESLNITLGLNGSFADNWSWEAHYLRGRVESDSRTTNHLENVKFAAALDAVRDTSGEIVCRITLTHPGLRDDCVPINVFGNGAPSEAAIDYVNGTQMYNVENELDEIHFNVVGEPFSTWAGPVTLVAGANYREQSIDLDSNSNPAPEARPDTTGIRGVPTDLRFLAANNGVAEGSYDTTEMFTEVAVPVLADQPFVEHLELNGAFRYIDYSTFGQEEAWKVGLLYQINDDLRFRMTKSQDIRAPTLFETFAGSSSGITGITDIHTGVSTVTQTEAGGNPDIQPETGETFTFGIGYRPSWLPGLTVTVDYYELEIEDIISTIPGTVAIRICHESDHTDPVCNFIDRPLPLSDTSPDNFPTSVREVPTNLGLIETDGVDLDVSYTSDSGAWTVRGIVNYTSSYIENSGIGGGDRKFAGVVSGRGIGGPSIPEWSGSLSVTYATDRFTAFVQERFVGSMSRVGGNAPNAVFAGGGDGGSSAVFYTDLTLEYQLQTGFDTELFLSVNNLFDKDPPLLPAVNDNPGISFPTELRLYDVIGRYFTLGARLTF